MRSHLPSTSDSSAPWHRTRGLGVESVRVKRRRVGQRAGMSLDGWGCPGLANSPFTQLSDDLLYCVAGDAVDLGAGISGVPIGEIMVVDARASVYVSVDLECELLNAMDA